MKISALNFYNNIIAVKGNISQVALKEIITKDMHLLFIY